MIVTKYGDHLGHGVYFMLSEDSCFALSLSDAIRACDFDCDFLPASLLDDNQRTQCWDAWKNAELVLGIGSDINA